ncbi:MAG: type II toxin-antitoxin system Phd/YefM family antitoxin [Pirellulaceae bacterium]
MKTVTAAEANRQFSALLRGVAQGEVFTVVSRGRSVAVIGPAEAGEVAQQKAKASLLARLAAQPVTGSRDWKRADLYE